MDSLRARRWVDAKNAFLALATKVTVEKKYRAYLAYARGREHQDSGNHGEARVEFGRALALEPDLEVVRAAMEQVAEAPAAKPTGNILTRWLKK